MLELEHALFHRCVFRDVVNVTESNKLSYRREAARNSVSLNVVRNYTVE